MESTLAGHKGERLTEQRRGSGSSRVAEGTAFQALPPRPGFLKMLRRVKR